MPFMTDEHYMQRCIDLARKGQGYVAPNPLVGCVIVHDKKIIGEGFHRQFGGPHAEVNAIDSVKNPNLLPHSTLYVNLEPCCHFGKTPPCTDLIVQKKIKKVVVGCVDPFDSVAGKGIFRLRDHGCEVETGIMKEECLRLNKRFFVYHEKKRPFVILKWAQTADGFIDSLRAPESAIRPTWITTEKLRMLVHKWRSEEASIMVGTETVRKDNPGLNVRDWSGKQPIRVIIDKDLTLPPAVKVLDGSQNTLVFNRQKDEKKKNTSFIKIPFDEMTLRRILKHLHQEGIQSLFVEGGQNLLQGFIDQDIWDEARVFGGPKFFGDGTRAPLIKPSNLSQIIIGKETFYWFRNYLNY